MAKLPTTETPGPEKIFPVSWDQFHRDSRALAWRLHEAGPFEAIVCITRGGLVPAAIVARELNEARLRMARIPKGAALVANKVSGAPGFWIGNVITMAGIPAVMQGMLDEVAPKLKTGTKLLSETIRADAKEGDVGTELGAIAKAYPSTIIGSYPFIDEKNGPNTNIVVRSRDAGELAVVKAEVEGMLKKVKAQLPPAR